MIDLQPESLAQVKEILADHIPEYEVLAFGSRVTGKAKPYSDLDVAIVGKERIETGRLNRLEEAFEFSDLPIRVDIVDWNAITEKFREIIQQNCEVLQKKQPR